MSYPQGPFSNKPSAIAAISIFWLWLAMFLPAYMFGQDDLNVHGIVSDAITSSKLADVTVNVKKNGSTHDSFTTRANGKYEFYLDCNSSYEFIFEKPGFVKRTIIIDANNIPEEVIGAGIIMPTDMSMFEITEAMEKEDLSVFDQPIGKAKYDPAQGDLVWDFAHTNKVKSDINSFMRDMEKRQKELDKEASAADKAEDEKEAKFNQLVKDGDDAMSKDKFQDAVLNFKAALDIKPEDLIVKGKLGDAETKYNAQIAKAKIEADYSAALDAGDGFMRTEEYQKAIDKYNAALEIKPGEKYPQDQIAEATKIVEKRAANMEKQAEFDALMADGEKLFNDKKYEDALAKYKLAKAIFTDNKEVDRRIEAVNEAIANKEALAAKQAEYDAFIASADKNFDTDKFEAALADYKAANAILQDEPYPVERIAATEAKITALANAAEQQANFDALVKDGDDAVAATDYQKAIDKYTEALLIFSDNDPVKTKLADAQGILAEKLADAQKQENYDALIVAADDLYKDEELASAKAKYEEARLIIPEETYPLDQITKIDARLKELAESAEAQETYNAAMASGNAALENKMYGEAISQFQAALGVFVDDKAATEALKNAQALKADFDKNQEVDAAYSDKLALADAKMLNEAFAEARTAYQEAQLLKPDEAYPQTQIDLIDVTLAQREADAAAAAEQDALEAEYQKYLNAGDVANANKNFAEAITQYENALGIKAGDVIAQTKLDEAKASQKANLQAAEIDARYAEWISTGDKKLGEDALEESLAAYREASDLKSDEKYPKDQIKLIEERIAAEAQATADAEAKAKAEQVNALILEGDNLVKDKAFEKSIVKYNEALSLMPEREDIQPKIDAAMQKMLAFQEAAGIEEAYADAIKDADTQYGKENWARAKSGYEQALQIKSTEQYPKDQLADIETKIAAEEAAAELERQKLVQAEFDDFIADGDKSVRKKKYEDALAQYEDALNLIPTSELAMEKVGEVQDILGALDKERADQIAYDKLVEEGDDLFNEASYEMARLKFLDAQELKPNENYPTKKIQEIDIQLEKLRLAALSEEADALNRQYREAVKRGDDLVIDESYDAAISAFEDALELKPNEVYPQGQIERINLLIKDKAEAEAEKARREALAKEQSVKPKRGNEQLSRVNSNSEQQAEQFMRDAREAQEKEKYERIKKLKEQQAANAENRESDSKDNRDAEYERIAEMKSQSGSQFSEAKSLSDEKIETSIQNKQALMKSREKLVEKHDILSKEAYETIQKNAVKRSEWMSDRESLHSNKVQSYSALKEAQLERIRAWSNASAEERLKISEKIMTNAARRYSENAAADDLRKERVEDIKVRETEIMEGRAKLQAKNFENIKERAAKNQEALQISADKRLEKNNEKVEAGAQKISEDKQRYSSQLDDAANIADKKREQSYADLQNVKYSEPKAYDDYYRSQLAENYPQGVSEESSSLGNKVIIIRIVVKGNRGDEYKKVLDKAGNYYFKNGQSISEHTWNRETIEAFNKSKD